MTPDDDENTRVRVTGKAPMAGSSWEWGAQQKMLCHLILLLSSEQPGATDPQIPNCFGSAGSWHVHDIGRSLAVQSVES